ncbi:MAG: DUF4116 domain-containing protein [Deltaproteobacteria bacterium]|nr:DUF4116 domain-containing protein [Deltaproteobacteria bacterium]
MSLYEINGQRSTQEEFLRLKGMFEELGHPTEAVFAEDPDGVSRITRTELDQLLDPDNDSQLTIRDFAAIPWSQMGTFLPSIDRILKRHGYSMAEKITDLRTGVKVCRVLEDPQDCYLRAIRMNPSNILWIDKKSADDGQLLTTVIINVDDPDLLQKAKERLAQLRSPEFADRPSADFTNDRKFANEAWGILRRDREFMLLACQRFPDLFLRFADEGLLKDADFILTLAEAGTIVKGNVVDPSLWQNRDFVRKMVGTYGGYLNYARAFQDDDEIVSIAVHAPFGGAVYFSASERLKARPDFFLAAVGNPAINILYQAPDSILSDIPTMKAAARKVFEGMEQDLFLRPWNPEETALSRFPDRMFEDDTLFSVILKAAFWETTSANPYLWQHPRLALRALRMFEKEKDEARTLYAKALIKRFSEDHAYALELVQIDGTALNLLNSKWGKDAEIALAAVGQNGWAYPLVDAGLRKSDPRIRNSALQQIYGDSLYADPKSWEDPGPVIEALDLDKRARPFAADRLNDPDFGRRMAAIDGLSIRHLPYPLRENPVIFREAIAQNGLALGLAPRYDPPNDHPIATEELSEIAIRQNPLAYRYVDDRFRNERLFRIALEKFYGAGSVYANPTTWKNPEAVDQAIQDNPDATAFVWDSLQDRRFAMALVQRDGRYYDLLPFSLREEPEIALAAAKDNDSAFKSIDLEAQGVEYIARAAVVNTRAVLKNAGATRDKIWKTVIEALHAEGAWFPPEIETDEKSFHAGLKKQYGISHPERFRSFATLYRLIQNREKRGPEDTRETALLIYPAIDWNGAFEDSPEIERFARNDGFRTIYFEADRDADIVAILDHYTNWGREPVHTGLLAAHSNSHEQVYGYPGDGEEAALDVDDFEKPTFARFGRYFKRQLLVIGCSVGRGREKGINLMNPMANRLPPSVRLYGSTIEQGVKEVRFAGLELKPRWPYDGSVYTTRGRRQTDLPPNTAPDTAPDVTLITTVYR